MASNVKFMAHFVEGNGVKARVWYSAHSGGVSIYSKDYDRKLGKAVEGSGLVYKNDTDTMTDYFDKGRVEVRLGSEHYAAVKARVEANLAARAAKAAKKVAGNAITKAWASSAETVSAADALDDFNYVGSRHHY